MQDHDGRRIIIGWIQEARTEAADIQAGWSGVMSLPRQLRIDEQGQLASAPITEVAALRTEQLHRGAIIWEPASEPTTSKRWLTEIHGDQLDIELDALLPPGSKIDLAVRASPDDSECTVITLDHPDAGGPAQLSLDRSRSSLNPDLDTAPLGGAVPINTANHVALRVLIDHSTLEIFVNGRALTSRSYPTSPASLGVWLANSGAEVHRLDAWRMADTWDGPRKLWPPN
jgi:beta-fructofuranosidase